ncbi:MULTISPECIES: SCO family protein [Acetobacterales]|uniref:SCO family protein n=1 Tax=Roseomonas sp. WGS1072 TaxID=3366816 RepID=UPI003BEFE2AC
MTDSLPRPPGRRALLGLLGLCAGLPAGSGATGLEAGAAEAGRVPRLRGSLPDAPALDAQGRRRRLVSQVLAGRVVAIDFVLTDCSGFCTAISAAMAGAQDLLGHRLGGEVGLLSLALDPLRATPEELAHYAERFEAGPGWDFVALGFQPLEQALRALGGPEAGSEHAPMVVVLDARRGTLRRVLGLPTPEAILGAVEAALAARRTA